MAATDSGDRGIPVPPVSPDYFIPGRFADKVILVTGAAGGIGVATATRAAREGGRVALMDINGPLLEQAVAALQREGFAVMGIHGDVRESADCERMVAECVAAFGRLDCAVNNAGVTDATDPTQPLDCDRDRMLLPVPVADATDAYWEGTVATNLTGVFKSLRAELRQFLAQGSGGAVVNVGSITALAGMPGTPAYVAAKHAVTGLTKNVALDYARYGIRANSVNMAQTLTPLYDRALEFVNWAREHHFGGGQMTKYKTMSALQVNDPEHRAATAWEQAAPILWLLSDDASNLTGACIATDGGWTAF